METIIVPFGSRVIVLTREEFDEALRRGDDFANADKQERATAEGTEGLLTAEDIAKAIGVPKAWLLDAARQKRVPHYRLGKYVRFRLSEVAAAAKCKT
jgi:excisionase family DNA binding protein